MPNSLQLVKSIHFCLTAVVLSLGVSRQFGGFAIDNIIN